MKKQVLAILLSTVMLTQTGAAIQAIAVEAPNVTSNIVSTVNADTRSVVDSGTCGEDLTWTIYDDGELVISGTGVMYNYSFKDSAPWVDYKSSISKLTLENGITSIGEYAFYSLNNLSGDLVIPDSVTSIGNYAFYSSYTMDSGSLTIPYSVTSIGSGAFQACNLSGELKIPDSITSISDYAFAYCYYFDSLTLPNSITSIGVSAFARFQGLTGELKIPEGVTTIGKLAFSTCDGITSVIIPNSVTYIGEWAFQDCVGLTSVTIPDSVKTIKQGAFRFCTGLTSVIIPNSVTSVGSSVFQSCDNLMDVYFAGTEADWAKVSAKFKVPAPADIHYNYKAHEHVYDIQETAAGCLTDGEVRYVCECGAEDESRREVIPATGHKYEKTFIDATCTAMGAEIYTCDNCGDFYTKIIMPKGHIEETIEGKAATCTEDGLTEGVKCLVCEEVLEAQEVIPATGHDYTVTIKASTCTKDGIETYICNDCGDKYTEVISATGHKEEKITGKVATCTENGLTDGVKCADCGATIKAQETIPATGHKEEVIAGKAATCTEAGLTDGKACADCGAVIEAQKEIPAKGHDYDELMTASADCTRDGIKNLVCKYCGDVDFDVVKATGHKWVRVAAVAPTCETAGRTEGMKCADCGDILVEGKTIAPLGHKFGETTVVKEATCCETGLAEKVCSACGKVETQVIEKAASKHDDGNNDGSCDDCGASTCGCICHTPAKKALYKFYKFFWKLFGIKGKRQCACGTMHW